MQELGDLQDLPVRDLRLLAHPREAARSDLELGHADGVLVGHGERELARRLRDQPAVAALPLDRLEALEPRQERFRIGRILVVGEPFDRRGDDRSRLARIVARRLIE